MMFCFVAASFDGRTHHSHRQTRRLSSFFFIVGQVTHVWLHHASHLSVVFIVTGFPKSPPAILFSFEKLFFCLFRLPFVLLLRLGPLCVSQFVWIPLCSSHTKTKTNKRKKNGQINPPSVVFHSLVMMRSFGPVRFNRLSR